MKAVCCSRCGLLVGPSNDPDSYGHVVIATPGNHEPVEMDGSALPSEIAICLGSEMLGHVVSVEA
jgi:hypothetical protein